MSQVKFEQRETIRTTNAPPAFGRGLAPGAPNEKHDLMHDVGNALTKGAGPNGYLAVGLLTLQRAMADESEVVSGEAAEGSTTNKNAHIWFSSWTARVDGIMVS